MGFRNTDHHRRYAAIAAIAAVLLVGAAALIVHGRADSAPQPPPPPALAASAVPYLPSHTSVVTADVLKKDAVLHNLSDEISSSGFLVGGARTFQGPSRHRLTLVVSRTLRFQTAAGAAGFASFVQKHAGAYVGQIPGVNPLVVDGRRGALITAPLCTCHMAEPALLGVVSRGDRVSWLEINGPAAKPALLRQLLAQSP
jgi:hypothetical protein